MTKPTTKAVPRAEQSAVDPFKCIIFRFVFVRDDALESLKIPNLPVAKFGLHSSYYLLIQTMNESLCGPDLLYYIFSHN